MPGEMEFELSSHKMLKDFSSKLPNDNSKCLNLIAYGDDVFYLWAGREYEVHAVNVKHTLREGVWDEGVVLTPRRRPLFEVEKLSLNNSGTLLCLQGTHGVAVLHLPESCEKESPISVQCVSLNERLFQGEQQDLRCAKWHPGSPTDSHLVVLTSDEYLRCYDTLSGKILWSCLLSKQYMLSAHSNLPSRITLGDTSVNFDFVFPTRPPDTVDLEAVEWPILVLWGSGYVFHVSSTLTPEKPVVSGPLLMNPPSDDNYGSDASSLIVLKGTPPLVVLSTCSGTLYHSLLMPAEDKEESERSNELCLHVLETIELELGIIVGEDDDIVSCPITLMADPVERSRYYCIHAGGIHLVTAPIVTKLHEFLENPGAEFPSLNYPSSVNYLLSTAVSSRASYECSPLLGACFVDLTMTLNVLLQDGKLINVKLLPNVLYSDQTLSTEKSESGDDKGLLYMIENLLKEGGVASQPMMKLPSNTTSQAWLELVLRTKQHFSTVIKTHEKISAILNARASGAYRAIEDQKKECDRLHQERTSLRETAEIIAEKCEEVAEKFSNLSQRLEVVVRNSYADGGGLTQKEINALESLRNLEQKIPKFEKDLKRIKATYEYQYSNAQEKLTNLNDSTTFYLNESQSRSIRELLRTFSDTAQELKSRLKLRTEQLIDEGIIK